MRNGEIFVMNNNYQLFTSVSVNSGGKYRTHKELRIWFERLNNLLLNTVKPKFGAIFVFLGTTSSFIEIIFSSAARR